MILLWLFKIQNLIHLGINVLSNNNLKCEELSNLVFNDIKQIHIFLVTEVEKLIGNVTI